MKSGPFINLVAEAFRLEAGTLKVIARRLREAGYLTTGARGVNAPDMTLRDAARLTIAILGGATPKTAVQVFQKFRGLVAFDVDGLYEDETRLQRALNNFELETVEDYITAVFVAHSDTSCLSDDFLMETSSGNPISSLNIMAEELRSSVSIGFGGLDNGGGVLFEKPVRKKMLTNVAELKSFDDWSREELDELGKHDEGMEVSRSIGGDLVQRIAIEMVKPDGSA